MIGLSVENKRVIRSFRSATEGQSHLYVAMDQDYITQKQFNEIYGQAVLVKNLIRGFMRYLKSRANR